MTYKEALESLKFEVYEEGHCSYIEEELDLAIKALEKQIPKKVTKSVCPSCNRIFLFRHSEKRKGDYCDNCGQALDWSDTE